MIKLILFVLGATLLGSSASYAQAGFDCQKAQSPTEQAICHNPEIAEADRALSVAFNALIERASPALQNTLRSDQHMFINARASAYEADKDTERAIQRLLDGTELRAEMLNWIATEPAQGLIGTWSNVSAKIEITDASNNEIMVKANGFDPVSGSWLCSFEQVIPLINAEKATIDDIGGQFTVERKDSLLVVPEPYCDEAGPSGNGTLMGAYFRIGAGD